MEVLIVPLLPERRWSRAAGLATVSTAEPAVAMNGSPAVVEHRSTSTGYVGGRTTTMTGTVALGGGLSTGSVEAAEAMPGKRG